MNVHDPIVLCCIMADGESRPHVWMVPVTFGPVLRPLLCLMSFDCIPLDTHPFPLVSTASATNTAVQWFCFVASFTDTSVLQELKI